MQGGQSMKAISSHVWLTPDLALGFHHFNYLEGEYDGLAHTHAEYSIVMCMSGAVEVLYEDRREIVRSGEILIVNPGEVHRCRFGVDAPNSRGFTLIVRPAVLHAVVEAMALPYSYFSRVFRFQGKFRNPEAFELTAKLIDEYREQRRGYGPMIEMMVRQILVHLFRSWPSDAVLPLEFRLAPQLPWLHMHRAMEYMNSHGKGAFRLPDLCDHVGASASRFIPLFKNSSGISPHSYYNALLIFKARRLLQVEGSSTKEAAYALGFKNVSHFCTLFHQLTGSTPKAGLGAPDDLLAPGAFLAGSSGPKSRSKLETLYAFTHLPESW
ncbi:MAG TPA: AraC family transcriptional regulator [Bryobacteraceae bacterium]|nr:AraC family transcriptional regulator [Bryobacteraceae bacterium]